VASWKGSMLVLCSNNMKFVSLQAHLPHCSIPGGCNCCAEVTTAVILSDSIRAGSSLLQAQGYLGTKQRHVAPARAPQLLSPEHHNCCHLSTTNGPPTCEETGSRALMLSSQFCHQVMSPFVAPR
jgi:hypothetical protein